MSNCWKSHALAQVVFHNFIAGKPDHEDPNHPDHVPSVFMHTTTTRKEREELLRKYLESKYIPSQRMTYTVDYLVNLKSYIGSRDFISKYRREGGGGGHNVFGADPVCTDVHLASSPCITF